MFDVIDLKFKNFFSKIKDCQDFEQIINLHEEFLGEVIANSFVKSKKIMRVIFDILFTTRKFYNFIENFLTNFYSQQIDHAGNNNSNNNLGRSIQIDNIENIQLNLITIKVEFRNKVNNLINIFSKIKNSKYFAIISQLLTKLDFQMSQ
jgi:hypothetical protein